MPMNMPSIPVLDRDYVGIYGFIGGLRQAFGDQELG